MADFDRESMMEMFSFEMNQLLEQLEQSIIQGESGYTMAEINEIFRIMHTLKGSAAMMMFDSISTTAHSAEDLFYFLREETPLNIDYSKLTDLVLEAMDFIKGELSKIESSSPADGDGSDIIKRIKEFLKIIKGEKPADKEKNKADESVAAKQESQKETKQTKPLSTGVHKFRAKIMFEDGCEMENIRAYTLVHNLGNTIFDVSHSPEDIIDEDSIDVIRSQGFVIIFSTIKSFDEINDDLLSTVYLKDMQLEEIFEDEDQKEVKAEGKKLTSYSATITFDETTEMENVRAFAIVHRLQEITTELVHYPKNISDESSIDEIKKLGFKIDFSTHKGYDEVMNLLQTNTAVKTVRLEESQKTNTKDSIEDRSTAIEADKSSGTKAEEANVKVEANAANAQVAKKPPAQHVISVSVSKLDQLLNLMGELVIAEAMVTQNPELEGLELESFHKETRQLRKIINDVQDTVMSMRMVPLSTTFFKMHRIVRDMCKQLNKDVNLEVLGEETEVDKNIIEHIADPLMHIIRNSIDHGIEMPDNRRRIGKSERGTVLLEAKNSGGDVLIIIRDDGAGLDKEGILKKAKSNGLLRKPESEYTDKEIHQFIFLPGFSTNETVTSFSGRGVGMDVVSTNLEIVGGSVLVDSTPGEGSVFTLKIPLTLAIIEGMTIKMCGSKYTIPIISIKQSFKAKQENVFADPNGNEMITVRGEVYNVVRLYEFFGVDTDVKDIEDGIMIMLENGDQTVCLFADELIGEQQVVVKTMPKYINKIKGISGCTLLGNGDISLIIDVAGFFDK